jgi:quercetin dioxygenase-like cupin family protein
MMHFKKTGDTELGHAHTFDHLTLLASGSLQVTVDDKTTVFNAPHMIFIKAEKVHELTAMQDNTVAFCIHALRSGERVEDIIDPESVPNGVELVELTRKLCV